MSRKAAFAAVILLVATMLVLRHYWADFRAGMDYPYQNHGDCR